MSGSSALDKLLKKVRACRTCEQYLPFDPNPILRATATARLLIVGQAPGTRHPSTQTGILTA